MPDPIQLVDPKTGQIFEADDEGMAERQMQAFGLQRAAPEQVQTYDEAQRSTTLLDKAQVAGQMLVGQGAELIEAGSRAGLGVQVDELTGETYGGGVVQAERIAPFVYTAKAKEQRRANPNTALATTIATDVATGLLIPGAGLGGIAASSVLSGLLTEAGTTLILEDEYSLKDAAIASGAGLVFEGAGALAFKSAMKVHGKVNGYLDTAVERARKAAAAGAEIETDATLATEKLRRNSEELYTKHQTTLDEALAGIDERTVGAPERMFTPGALKKTVSQNITAQEEAFLDMAVKFDQAAQVADAPGFADVAATMQGALGKSGAGMFEAMRAARRQLDALGAIDNPLVKEAAEALDSSLRHQPTWGKAAQNHADIADDIGSINDNATVNLREPNAREVLDQRLDRARRMASLTGDKKLKQALKQAEDALEGADKVTGARFMAETTPAEIAQLQKKLDGFEKRAPKLGAELHETYTRLNKQLDGVLGDLTEDGALDYVAARASNVGGGKVDPLRDVLVKAEKQIANMKAKGANPTQIARASSALKDVREAVGEVHDIPRATRRVRDWQAKPQPGKGFLGKVAGKIGAAGDDIAVEEIQNALQPMLHGAGVAVGLHAGGIPGAALGYLGGRAVNKAFGERIARWVWKRGKNGAIEFAKKNPLEAVGAVGGALAGRYMGSQGAIAGAIGGRNAARKVRAGAQSISRKVWKQTQKTVAEEGERRAGRAAGADFADPPRGAVSEFAHEAGIRAGDVLEDIEKLAGSGAKATAATAAKAWEVTKDAARGASEDIAGAAADAAKKAGHVAGDAVSAAVDAAQKAGVKAPEIAAAAQKVAKAAAGAASDVARAATGAAKRAGAVAADVARAASETATKAASGGAGAVSRAAQGAWNAAEHAARAAAETAKDVARVAQRAALKTTSTARSVAAATAAAARKATVAANDVARAAMRAFRGAGEAASDAIGKPGAAISKKIDQIKLDLEKSRDLKKSWIATTKVVEPMADFSRVAERVKDGLGYVDRKVWERAVEYQPKIDGNTFDHVNARLARTLQVLGKSFGLDPGTTRVVNTLKGVVKRARQNGHVVHGEFYHATGMHKLSVARLLRDSENWVPNLLLGAAPPPTLTAKIFMQGTVDKLATQEAFAKLVPGMPNDCVPVIFRVKSRGAVPISEVDVIMTTPGARLLVKKVVAERGKVIEIYLEDISLTAQRRRAKPTPDYFTGDDISAAKAGSRAVDEAERVPMAGRLLDAAKKNPGQVAGVAAFAGAGALAADDDQTEGASLASAGLLLLLLPRGLGMRQARATLAEKGAQLASHLPHPGAASRIQGVIAATGPNNAATLRRAVLEDTYQWTPEELIDDQARFVNEIYEARFGEPLSDIGSKNFVRNELWIQNLDTMDGSDALTAAYQGESNSLIRAEHEQVAASSPHAPSADEIGLRERGSDLEPELAARLEHDARQARQSLYPEMRRLVEQTLNGARDDIETLARRYIAQAETNGRVLGSVDDLMAAQVARLQEAWTRLGLELPTHMSAVTLQNAAEAELRSINAAIAQQNMPTRLITRTAAQRQAYPEPLPRSTRLPEVVDAPGPDEVNAFEARASEAMNALPHEGRVMIGRLNRHAGDEIRSLRQSFLDGTATAEGERLGSATELLRRQLAAVDEAWQAVGPGEGVDIALRQDIRAAMTLELQRSNARVQANYAPSGAWNRLTGNAPTPQSGPNTYAQFMLPSGERAQGVNRAMARLSRDANLAMGRAADSQVTNGARMLDEFVQNGHAWDPIRERQLRTVDEVVEYQSNEVLRRFAADEQYGLGSADAASANEREAARQLVLHHNSRHAVEAEAGETRGSRESRLKPSDERAAPAVVDGVPFEAATRLDDALQEPLERMGHGFDTREAGHDSSFMDETLPGIEDIARQVARDNPGMLDEEAALGYARRRHADLATEMRVHNGNAGPVWETLTEERGFARATAFPPDDDVLSELLEEANLSLADDDIRNYFDDVLSRVEREYPDMTSRERRRARELYDDQESSLDDAWRERRDRIERNAEPDSEPTPDSGGYSYGRQDDDGLPEPDELRDIGLRTVEMNNSRGIHNVFGQALDTEDLVNLLSLKYVNQYANEVGETAMTKLVVSHNSVNYEAEVTGGFSIDQTYRRTGGGDLKVIYGILKIPPEKQGTGIMKDMARDLVEPLERLGADELTTNAAWMGRYAWLALGFRPPPEAEQLAIDTFRRSLVELAGGESPMIAEYMTKITDTRALAHAWLPADLIKDRLPELRQGWAEISYKMSGEVEAQSFEEAVMRTSHSGREQFLAGKYFLLASNGHVPWNSELSIKVRPGEAWYDDMKKALGLSVGALAVGFGIHELMGAFSNHSLTAKGIPEADTTPPEVQAYDAEMIERAERVEQTREKLGYLKTESEVIARDTARAIANKNPRERVVATLPGVTSSQGIARFLGSHSTLKEAFDDKRDVLTKMQQNPMLLVDELTDGLAEVQEHAPDLHGKMVQQTYKVVGYLQSKLPGTIGASLTRPEGSPPNALAVRQFALYFSAATDPTSVMGDLANNRARKEQIDTLREVWPDVYEDLKGKVIEQLSQGRPTVAQRTRLDLLFDLGEGLDRGLSPRLVQALAAHRAKAGAPGAPGDGATPGAGKQAPSRRTQPSVGGTGALGSLALGAGGGPRLG